MKAQQKLIKIITELSIRLYIKYYNVNFTKKIRFCNAISDYRLEIIYNCRYLNYRVDKMYEFLTLYETHSPLLLPST